MERGSPSIDLGAVGSLLAAVGGLALIPAAATLDWFGVGGVSATASNALDALSAFEALYLLIAGAAGVAVGLRALLGAWKPPRVWAQAALLLGTGAVLGIIGRLLAPPTLDAGDVVFIAEARVDRLGGAWIGLLCAIAMTAGAALALRGGKVQIPAARPRRAKPPRTKAPLPAPAPAPAPEPPVEAQGSDEWSWEPPRETRARTVPRKRPAPRAAERPAPASPKAEPPAGELLDINQATFDELRDLGLSVTQARRLERSRDLRGGFVNVDELDEVPGLPAELRAELRRSLRVGPPSS